MNRHFALAALAACACALPLPASSADPAPARPAAKPAAKAPARAAAEAPARQAEPTPLSDTHLQIADRVLTGQADCEFNQSVSVEPISGRPGHFRVAFKKLVYTMVPEETTTGAVRLEDRAAGVVWLQIPSKSMLMNTKLGQRMVDACTHAEQRAAVAAVQAAARSMAADSGLGIAPAAAASAGGN